MSETAYQKGDKVVYYQPGVDGILDIWSGKRPRNDGSEKTVTITSARTSGGVNYYDTDGDVMLMDSDIRRKA